jgi:hypothetical protein
MHGSLVTSSLIRETTENESANEGYRFGQEEETYNIVAAQIVLSQIAKLGLGFSIPQPCEFLISRSRRSNQR